MEPIKNVQAGGPSIANEDTANAIINRVNALTALQFVPEELGEMMVEGKTAKLSFNMETMLVIRDGILTKMEVPAIAVEEVL